MLLFSCFSDPSKPGRKQATPQWKARTKISQALNPMDATSIETFLVSERFKNNERQPFEGINVLIKVFQKNSQNSSVTS
jgi:hypothetical protein